MEQIPDNMDMLYALSRPAFCVKDGTIVKVNSDAAAFLIETGTSITCLLKTGAEEYAAFSGGCLYLSLNLAGHSLGCSVMRMKDFDLFCIEEDEDDREFRTLAVAALAIREPLTRIMSSASQLYPHCAPADNPKAREQTARMNQGFMQLLRILNNMSEAGSYQKDSAIFQEIRDICSVIDEIFEKGAALAEHAGVALHYEGYREAVYSLNDSEKLERAILNIVNNAIKFTPAGGTIDAKLTRRGSKLYLSVQDSGCGIDESVQGTLFSRYNRRLGQENSRSGIGLGMVLIRAAAAAHGGTVLVDQPSGSGVRVTISLAIRQNTGGMVRSPIKRPDYAGEYDHALLELSDVLPYALYDKN